MTMKLTAALSPQDYVKAGRCASDLSRSLALCQRSCGMCPTEDALPGLLNDVAASVVSNEDQRRVDELLHSDALLLNGEYASCPTAARFTANRLCSRIGWSARLDHFRSRDALCWARPHQRC